MKLENLVELARGFANLGGAVGEQVDDVVDGRFDDVNPNAVAWIEDWLTSVRDEAAESDEELVRDVEGVLARARGWRRAVEEDEL